VFLPGTIWLWTHHAATPREVALCANTEVAGAHYGPAVRPDERAVLERAIQRVTVEAANADAIVDEAMAASLAGSVFHSPGPSGL
jgi:hypothetical protein